MTRRRCDAFEERWRRRFRERGRLCTSDAAIAGWSPGGLVARLRLFRHVWRPARPGDVWVDVGCSAGTYSRYLAARKMRVLGVDYSLPSLDKARARASTDPVRWAAADARALPLATDTVDGVLCLGVLQVSSDPFPLMAESARVLRPGGEYWVSALNRWCLPTALREALRVLRRRPMHLRYYGPGALRRTLLKAGFDDVRVHWVPLLPPRLSRLQPLLETAFVRAMLARLPGLALLVSHAVVFQCTRRDSGAEQR